MFNFIVVDDVPKYLDKVESIIASIMMNVNNEYKIHRFTDYSPKFMKLINQPLSNKIYILDIETHSASGIDVARKIRKNDLNSIIIFMTAYEDAGNLIIKKILLTLSLVSKFDEFDLNMKNSIKEAISIIGKKKTIKIQDDGSVYIIPVEDILYVTRDSVDRKAVIITSYDEFRVNKSLIEIKELVGTTLKQSHRACLVNEDRIRKIDKRNNIIHFDDGKTTDLMSASFKKELV